MSKYLPEGWTQDRIDDALEFQRKYPNPTNHKQEDEDMKNQAKDNLDYPKITHFKLYKGTEFGETGQHFGPFIYQRVINAKDADTAIRKCRAMGISGVPYMIENMETGEKTSF